MGRKLLAALGLAIALLTGCATYPGPTAGCFSFAAAGPEGNGCDFRPVAGAERILP